MSENTRMIPAELQQLDFGDIGTGSFTLVGLFANPAREFLIQNFTDQMLYFSIDGFLTNFVLPPSGFYVFDAGTNHGTSNTAAIPSGFGLYAQAISVAPTSGAVYLSYFYLD